MQTEIATVPTQRGDASLSVVFLCFNDAATIGGCVREAFEVLGPVAEDLEVIVVEDGSRDHSREILGELMGRYPGLKVIHHPHNLGYGKSLADGILSAVNKFVLCVDGDNQFDLRDATQLLLLADGCYEIISGCRSPRADPWYRCASGWMYNRVVQLIFALPVQDVDCGFKLIHRASAGHIFPTKSNLVVWVEALIKAKKRRYRCANMVVRHRPRASGQSTVFNVTGILRVLWELVAVGFRFKLLYASYGFLRARPNETNEG